MPENIDLIDCAKHKIAGECGIEGCTNRRKANGPCPKCGVGRYKRLCGGKTCPRRSVSISEGNPHSIANLAIRMGNGESMVDLEKEIEEVGRKRAKETGKKWGECESCENKTVLVSKVGLCGPCCFGEAETFNGNF